LSTTSEPGMTVDTPFAPVPDADDPRRGKEVFAPANAPFEAAATFVPGPYYKGVEERMPELAERAADAVDTLIAGMPSTSKFSLGRRDFMKLFSASTVAATSACVQRPVERAIPFVQQPVDQWPGEPVNYATTCGDCSAGCGVMVKTREGRPTKAEGLPEHPVNAGRLCAVGQASLQGLFHPERQHQPLLRYGAKLQDTAWSDAFAHIAAKITDPSKVGIITNGATGHRHGFFREFLEKIGGSANHLYTFDANSLAESIVAAHQLAYGIAAMPRAELNQAKLIVGIGADFLDIGTSLIYYTRTYTDGHAFQGDGKGRHVQFESTMTLTGGRADERVTIPPGSETLTALLLTKALLKNGKAKGSSSARAQIAAVLSDKATLLAGGYDRLGVAEATFDQLAADLLVAPAVVMAGGSSAFDENATALQMAAIMANELIGAYGSTLHLDKDWATAPVVPGDLNRFLADAKGFDVLFVIDCDPVFTLPPAWGVEALLKAIPHVVTMGDFPSETAAVASHRLNTNHWLESWGDEQSIAGLWSIRQPTVRPTTDSRQSEDILMWIAASLTKPMGYEDYRDYLKKKWAPLRTLMGRSNVPEDIYFDLVLQHGYDGRDSTQIVPAFSSSFAQAFKYQDYSGAGLRLIAPLDFRLRDGRHAHKPVLQETADTMTTITWDTWVALSPATTARLGLRKYDVVKVEGPGGSFEASVYPLPGLHADAVVVPRGNGHSKDSGLVQGGNGINPLVALAKASDGVTGAVVTAGQAVKITATGRVFPLAQLQKHNDIANRKDIIKTVGLATAVANAGKTQDLDDVPDIYPALPKKEHRWGMSIDLSRCTGCNACVVACFTENNIPQVGREQVMLGRQMHWIQIDRYFSGAVEAPEVTLQPMLCQHCTHAPCEPVCPVFATTHDPEGVNTMTYNRCIGTRYCANACPYKVRRFNWWTHRWNQVGERLQDRNPRALNPDVTVRTRGVMEKCSFCYQRVRDGRHKEKINKVAVGQPGNIVKTACQQTCPADAITFGNLLDTASPASQLRRDMRAYMALNGDPAEKEYGLKTLPNVSYLAKVVFKEPESGHHGAKEGHGAGAPHHEGAEHEAAPHEGK